MKKNLCILGSILFLYGCSQTLRDAYKEPVLDNATESSNDRPEWVNKAPERAGRIFIVTSSSECLSMQQGERTAKAFALAELAERIRTNVKVTSRMKGHGPTDDLITWNANAMLRSLSMEKVHWEKRYTMEGLRYNVWVLWSIPEKAFYESQESELAK